MTKLFPACALLLIPVAAIAQNTDPNYTALRTAVPAGSWTVNSLVLKRDVGTFTFQRGTFSFSQPVLGKTTFAVFAGEGSFHLTPATPGEASHLRVVTGAAEMEEAFRSVVFCFTDGTADEVMAAAQQSATPSNGTSAFQEFRSNVRRRTDEPRGMVEAILGGEDAANIDAELLRELYTPGHESFAAYIHGLKHSDLRFIVNPSGALPQLPSAEEVALIDPEPDNEHEGILYLSHFRSEVEKHTADSRENHRWVQAQNYRIDTAIGGNDHLTGTCEIRMKILTAGTRVVKFGLLPALRVESVSLAGKPIAFLQESRKEDGSFYLIFPTAMPADSVAEVTIQYSGDKVLHKAGSGNFYVEARTSWYPGVNSFTDRATYDLTFRVPKRYTLVSVGTLEKSSVEKDTAVTHWVATVPLAVAGFNYGEFKKLEKKDEQTGYQLEVYAATTLPDELVEASGGTSMNPNAMAQSAMSDASNSLRLFDAWFGKIPYRRIAVTEQPNFNFGQSWPSLVFLPISAFLDPGSRYKLLGSRTFAMNSFIDEVTPHEVAHQWWGHIVGWASYRDQWLSEGFADFSAGIFLEATGKSDEAEKFWERSRKRITDRNEFGVTANEAGPLNMGIRLYNSKNQGAYGRITYSKGAYVLEMLRSLMWDAQNQDKTFMAMMHEFVASPDAANASTESFAALASKYMRPALDLGGDKTFNWFFSEWAYGTDIPRYRFEYSLTPDADGKFLMTGKLTQSDVSPGFRMAVPIYMENANKQLLRIGMVPVIGNNTATFRMLLPIKPKRMAANVHGEILSLETVSREAQ